MHITKSSIFVPLGHHEEQFMVNMLKSLLHSILRGSFLRRNYRFIRKLHICLVITLLAHINFKHNLEKEGSTNRLASQSWGQEKKMSKQPGIYFDIGRNATDYIGQSPIHYHYNGIDWSLYFKCQVSGIAPGLSTLLKLCIPDPRSNRAEVQYMNNYFGVATGITLTRSPLLSLSGVTGIGYFSIGTDITFDTATKTLDEYGAGLSFTTSILTASLTLSDKADTLRAHCYWPILPLTNTGVAADLTHRFISKQTTLTLGAQHCLFPFMLIKARVTSDGSLGALVQNNIFSALSLTIGTELSVMDSTKPAKLGITLAFKH